MNDLKQVGTHRALKAGSFPCGTIILSQEGSLFHGHNLSFTGTNRTEQMIKKKKQENGLPKSRFKQACEQNPSK